MLFQDILLERILATAITQIWPIILFPYFAYKLLKRSRNRSVVILSISFINYTLVLLIAFLSIFFAGTPFSKILYSISLYIFFFNHGLYILISWLMTRLVLKTKMKLILIIISSYLSLATYVFWIGYPLEGLIYGPSTGWRPVYSWLFFWVSFSYVTIFLIIPQIFLAKKLYHDFKGLPVVNRVNQLTIGVFLSFVQVYLLLLYNTLVEISLYQVIHIFIALPLNLTSAYLVYLGIVKSLD